MTHLRRTATPLLAALATGVLVGVRPSSPLLSWALAFGAWAPLLWALRGATWRRALALGGLAGLPLTSAHTWWLSPTLQSLSDAPSLLAAAITLLHAAWLAVPVALASTVAVVPRSWPRRVALFGAAYVLLESLWPSPFPFTLSYHYEGLHPAWQVAALGGRSGPMALLLAGNAVVAAVADAVIRRRRPPVWAYAIAGLVISLLGWGSWRIGRWDARATTLPTLRVGLVQANAAPGGARERRGAEALLQRQQEASVALADRGAELLVWGESAYPFPAFAHGADEGPGAGHSLALHRGFDVPVLFGATRLHPELKEPRRWNSALLVAADGAVLGAYDKVHRFPVTEYAPPWLSAVRRALAPGWRGYQAGTGPVVFDVDGATVAPLVCREDLLPRYVRRAAQLGPEILVVITNDVWFGDTSAPGRHLALARLRAIETGRPIARVSNAGPTGWIDPAGRIHQATATRAPDREEPASTVLAVVPRVPTDSRTLFVAVGSWLEWVAAGLIVALAGARRRRRAE